MDTIYIVPIIDYNLVNSGLRWFNLRLTNNETVMFNMDQ